jgi:hypothetical protein
VRRVLLLRSLAALKGFCFATALKGLALLLSMLAYIHKQALA